MGVKMDWKWYMKITFILLFFMSLVIIGSNVSAQRLAIITDQSIAPPFWLKNISKTAVQLELLGDDINYSFLPVIKSYTYVKVSIQNSLVTVKCNLVPRLEYLNFLWSKGIKQFKNDLQALVKVN